MYDESSASCFASESSSQEEETGVSPNPAACPPKHDMKEKKQSSAAGNKTVALLLPGQPSVGSNSDHDKSPENNDNLEEYHDAEQEEVPTCSNNDNYSRASSLDITSHKKKRKARTKSRSGSDCDNNLRKTKKK
jgi:hypothetical protein